MNIAVIGLGYIGLPTAALLANSDHCVYGYDRDTKVRRALQQGIVPATESAVRSEVGLALETHRLHVVDSIPIAKAYIICVPTPARDGKPDLRSVEEAALAVARAAPRGALLILESTVPPGTTERVLTSALHAAGKPTEDYVIAHCPERVIPGAIVEELRSNARVVGGRTREDAQYVAALYASFCNGPIALTTTTTAEFVKVAENTFRDVNIAYANELAIVSEDLGIDVWEAIALANAHPRVNILMPGPGVGGHCIPVDPRFLSESNPLVTELVQAARRVNERMPYRVVRRLTELVPADESRRIALLGAAYKADVDDARESPTIRINALLRERGYATAVYDPHVQAFSEPLCETCEEAVTAADAVVLVTPHSAFRALDPKKIAPLMRGRYLVDTRNFFDAKGWEDEGFTCYVLGRRLVRAPAWSFA